MSNFPLQELAEEFDNLCQVRHEMGATKYGPITFLDRDTMQDIFEEIADAANYLRYLYIKLRLIESGLNVNPPEQIGVEAFKTQNKKGSR